MNTPQKPRKIIFLIFSNTHLLDLSGPAQVFYEANEIGNLNLDIRYASKNANILSEQGLLLSGLQPPENITLTKGDLIVIPGIDFATFKKGELQAEINEIRGWLTEQFESGVRLASICSGSLILLEAGLLDGRSCTSHWKCIDYIKESFPESNIYSDRLFVKDQNIYTSAGMTSGIDMSLAIIEERYGPVLASQVAREIVVYLRRDKDSSQESIYLDYQTHFNPSIHKVQDYIISHPQINPNLDKLSSVANMSSRSLTRTFKQVTGHTIMEFKHEVKLTLAKTYLNNPDYTIEAIAQKCGFSNPRQLRRIWQNKTGESISSFRRKIIGGQEA